MNDNIEEENIHLNFKFGYIFQINIIIIQNHFYLSCDETIPKENNN